MTVDQTEPRDRLAGGIVASIVHPPLEAGERSTEVLVLLESVIVGVVLSLTKLGGDEIAIDTIMEGVKKRLAERGSPRASISCLHYSNAIGLNRIPALPFLDLPARRTGFVAPVVSWRRLTSNRAVK